MKKQLAIAAVCAAVSTGAQAENKYYIGMEYNFVNTSLEDVNDPLFASNASYDTIYEDSHKAITPYVGVRFNDNWGLELGYTAGFSADKNNAFVDDADGNTITGTTESKINSLFLDANGYLNLNDKSELIGSLGISRDTVKSSITIDGLPGVLKSDESDLGFRIGGGVQHAITEKLNARAMIRYHHVDNDIIDTVFSYNLGFNYSF